MFEDIKHIDEFGNEYWLARELQSILGCNHEEYTNQIILGPSDLNDALNEFYKMKTKTARTIVELNPNNML